jgi:hypothetical protein
VGIWAARLPALPERIAPFLRQELALPFSVYFVVNVFALQYVDFTQGREDFSDGVFPYLRPSASICG